MQMLLDGRRVFTEKLTNSLAIALLRNTRRIVGIFITNCAFKSRVFCWFNHLNTPCRTGDLTFYKHVVKTMQMLLDGRRVFTEKLTNSLAIALLRNTRRIVGIFITNCAFKSRVFCWFILLSQRFRDGDRKTNMTSARQVVLDNYANSRRHTIILVVICATACASARNFFEMARLIFDSKDSSIYV